MLPRFNEKVLAEMRRQEEMPSYRQRTGRLDKWKELSKAARDALEVELPAADRLTCPGST